MTGGTSGNVALPAENAAGFLDIRDQVSRFRDKRVGRAVPDRSTPRRAEPDLLLAQAVTAVSDEKLRVARRNPTFSSTERPRRRNSREKCRFRFLR